MGFLEKLRNRNEGTEISELRKVHRDFQYQYGQWLYTDGKSHFGLAAKVRFAFDDPELLNECPFYAKIGMNKDKQIPQRYIGFAYDHEKSRLLNWAERFPFAELIDGLDHQGVSTLKVLCKVSEAAMLNLARQTGIFSPKVRPRWNR
jgi:hypothetical protein